jgi:predicted PhzF superfamily epimerase YddE/YHI9
MEFAPFASSEADLAIGVVAPRDSEEDGTDANLEVRGFITARSAEDPVTGSLNVGLGLWLIGSGNAPDRHIANQGTVVGRAGRGHGHRDWRRYGYLHRGQDQIGSAMLLNDGVAEFQ